MSDQCPPFSLPRGNAANSFRPHLVAFVTIAALSWGCGDSTGPAIDQTKAIAADPVGDTFGGGAVPWDVTALSIVRDAGGVTVRLTFSKDVVSPVSGDPAAMIGFVDLDVDQNAGTGITPTVDEFRVRPGSTGMGADFELDLANYLPDGSVAVRDAHGVETGRVTPVFSARDVAVYIPKELLGNDDGFLNAAAIVGATAGPSDIVPENGHLTVGNNPK